MTSIPKGRLSRVNQSYEYWMREKSIPLLGQPRWLFLVIKMSRAFIKAASPLERAFFGHTGCNTKIGYFEGMLFSVNFWPILKQTDSNDTGKSAIYEFKWINVKYLVYNVIQTWSWRFLLRFSQPIPSVTWAIPCKNIFYTVIMLTNHPANLE